MNLAAANLMVHEIKMKNNRNALTLPELIIVFTILVFVLLILLSRMPRAREEARAVNCLSNLNQIGQAFTLYAQANDGLLPAINSWSDERSEPGTSAFYAMRVGLSLGDFADVATQLKSTQKSDFKISPDRVGGLRCPSDRTLLPISATNYRANSGGDSLGKDGPFAIGKSVTMQQIEAADGLSFTAAFSERLIGDGSKEMKPANYLEMDDCASAISISVVGKAQKMVVRSDSGHQWSSGDWQNTLYHHGLTPNWATSAISKSGNCGQMGASSGHSNYVHLLLMDGSAKAWRSSVDPVVWKRLGRFQDDGVK